MNDDAAKTDQLVTAASWVASQIFAPFTQAFSPFARQLTMPSMIMWTWNQAPQAFRDLSTCGGDEAPS
jgi:hypothetical protein